MARGWESKAVEAQIEEGEGKPNDPPPRLTPQDRELHARRYSLELDRSRLQSQLEVATSSRYREILMKGLKSIEQQLDDLGS